MLGYLIGVVCVVVSLGYLLTGNVAGAIVLNASGWNCICANFVSNNSNYRRHNE